MKPIDYLIIQSTNSTDQEPVDKVAIIKLHTASKRDGGYGWNRPGIDYLISANGSLETILPETSPTSVDLWEISAGKDGITGSAKYIAYAEGKTKKGILSKDSRSEAQKKTLEAIVKFYVLRFPRLIVLGFDQVAGKSSAENPGFSVPEWLTEIGVAKGNIYKAESTKQKESK